MIENKSAQIVRPISVACYSVVMMVLISDHTASHYSYRAMIVS